MRNEGVIPTTAEAPKDATSRERAWFPKEESVALGILGYVLEDDGGMTLEDIVEQMSCNAASALAAVGHLRKVGYLAARRDGDRIPSTKNPKWGRNVLRATQRGRHRYARHLEEMKKVDAKETRRGAR